MGSECKHVVRECDNCGEEIRAYAHRKDTEEIFCSRECSKDYHHVERECAYCGSTFEIGKAQLDSGRKNTGKYCSEDCMDKWRSENWVGENNPLYIDSEVECDYCGDPFQKRPAKIDAHDRHYCSRECHGKWLSENNSGSNHPRWKGGKVGYGSNWYEQRKKALERDGYTCQDCGVHNDELERNLSVHHITPRRDFDKVEESNELNNLVTLCISCHSKWEGLYLRPDTR